MRRQDSHLSGWWYLFVCFLYWLLTGLSSFHSQPFRVKSTGVHKSEEGIGETISGKRKRKNKNEEPDRDVRQALLWCVIERNGKKERKKVKEWWRGRKRISWRLIAGAWREQRLFSSSPLDFLSCACSSSHIYTRLGSAESDWSMNAVWADDHRWRPWSQFQGIVTWVLFTRVVWIEFRENVFPRFLLLRFLLIRDAGMTHEAKQNKRFLVQLKGCILLPTD